MWTVSRLESFDLNGRGPRNPAGSAAEENEFPRDRRQSVVVLNCQVILPCVYSLPDVQEVQEVQKVLAAA